MKLSESEESEVEGAGDEEVEEENGMELEEGSGPIDGGSDVAQQVTADSLVESEESIPLIKT